MDITLLILVVMVSVALAIAFWKGRWQLLVSGLKRGCNIFKSMWLRILIGITLGGLIQVLIPHELIAEWIGPESGLKGILIGSYVGVISIGGPHVRMPIIASIYTAGAGAGPIIALLIAMNLLSLQMLLTWQIPFFGVKVPLASYIACLFIPPLAGLVGGGIYELLKLTYV
jgi:uncharacterized membrane protein YraQ (UPF0718 family)